MLRNWIQILMEETMKMKKKLKGFCTIFLSIFLLGGPLVASATEYASMSGRVLSPKFKLNTWSYGPAYRLYSNYTPLTGVHCGVWFDTLGQLETGYSSANRDMQLVLGNREGTKETIIKRYTLKIQNRKVTDVYLAGIDVSGNVSSTKYGNLFLAGYLPKFTGEADYQGVGTNLFYYNIVVE